MVQTSAHRQHGEDQGKEAGVDVAKGFIGVNAACDQNQSRAQKRERMNFRNAKSRKHNNSDQRCDGYGSMPSAIRPRRGVRYIDHFHIRRQALDIFRRAFK